MPRPAGSCLGGQRGDRRNIQPALRYTAPGRLTRCGECRSPQRKNGSLKIQKNFSFFAVDFHFEMVN